MGAGRHRWWEEPPFARTAPSATGIGGPTTLVVGGVYCGSGPTLQLRKVAEQINRARGEYLLRLEAELERFKQRAVAVDMALDSAKVLESISDGALLDELERRGAHLEVELWGRRQDRDCALSHQRTVRRQPGGDGALFGVSEHMVRSRDRADAMALVFASTPGRPPREIPREVARQVVRVMNITTDEGPAPDVLIVPTSPHAAGAAVDLASEPLSSVPFETCARKGCAAVPTRGKHCAIHQPPGRPRRRR